ncbi:MAG: glycosyltransferase family 2 protein [Paludibacter sp.]|jgi:glycosyltransferase involved in cell wall biosynthesis|nr:glycosyltransferase family 2 protein [Paludibacter sp.]
MDTKPLISVIIPVRNGEKHIGEAIESVINQQNNDFRTEIIVVDDGSTDGTKNVVYRYCGFDPQSPEKTGDFCLCENDSVQYFYQQASGAIVARNFGFEQTNGDFVLFHDADDVLNADALQTLYYQFVINQKIQVALALRKDFYSPEMTEEERQKLPLRAEGYGGAIAGCALFRRSVFDTVGLFDENLRMAGDAMEFLLRLEKYNVKTLKINYIAVSRRIHANNMGRTSSTEQHNDYAAVLRQKLFKKG